MHLPKPIYEALPYFYVLAGVMFIAGAAYVSHWYTGAPVYSFFGFFCVVSGVSIWLRRFTYRRAARKRMTEDEDLPSANA